MIAKKIIDTNADVDCRGVPPPEYSVGGDSKREGLCQQDLKDSPWRRLEHQAPGNWKRLEHCAPGDRLLLKIRLTLLKWTSAKNFKPQSEEEHEFYNEILDSNFARFGEGPTNLQDFPAQRCHLEPIFGGLPMGFILADQGSRNARSDTVRTTTSENTDRSQRTCKICRTGTFRWSKITSLSDPAAKFVRIKVYAFSNSTLCWSLESRSIQKLQDVWNEHGLSTNWTWQPDRCDWCGTYYQVLLLLTPRNIFRFTWTGKIQNLSMKGSYSCLCSTTLTG